MFLYVVLSAILGIIGGILLSVLVRRDKSVEYTTLDKVGVITNIVLAASYLGFAPFYMFLGMITTPYRDGFWGIVGVIICAVSGSAALAAGVGVGASVALRRRGKKVLSFVIQFAGVLAIALTFIIYMLFVGTLIAQLN